MDVVAGKCIAQNKLSPLVACSDGARRREENLISLISLGQAGSKQLFVALHD